MDFNLDKPRFPHLCSILCACTVINTWTWHGQTTFLSSWIRAACNILVVAVPTTPRSIELDLEGRQEWLVDSCKLKVLLQECRHPTVIHVVLLETHMDVENESRSGLDIFLWLEFSMVEGRGVCHLVMAEVLEQFIGV